MAFQFATAGDIRFGRGTADGAAKAAQAFGTRVLVVHGRSSGRAQWLIDALNAQGSTIATVSTATEPDLEQVDSAAAKARAFGAQVVVALGGGSVIDLGKAVAALAPADGPALRYLEVVGDGQPLPANPLPMIAVPTTAGTGAEVTKNAVISVPAHRQKVSLRDARMIPDIAIVDPALTDGAPGMVTFSSGLDAVTQVIEPFLSSRASALTNALCVDAIPRGLGAMARLSRGEDPGARDDIALTSLLGGMALANAGLGAVHGLAGVIGGRTDAPHGAVCAALLPAVLDFNARHVAANSVASQRIEQVFGWIAAALGGTAANVPDTLAGFVRRVGVPTLDGLGLRREDFDAIATAARSASSSRTNPVPPDDVDFHAILTAAFDG